MQTCSLLDLPPPLNAGMSSEIWYPLNPIFMINANVTLKTCIITAKNKLLNPYFPSVCKKKSYIKNFSNTDKNGMEKDFMNKGVYFLKMCRSAELMHTSRY